MVYEQVCKAAVRLRRFSFFVGLRLRVRCRVPTVPTPFGVSVQFWKYGRCYSMFVDVCCVVEWRGCHPTPWKPTALCDRPRSLGGGGFGGQ